MLASEGMPAATVSPQPDRLLWLAEAQLASGQRDAAEDTARRVLGAVPGNQHAQDIIDQAEGREPAATAPTGGGEK